MIRPHRVVKITAGDRSVYPFNNAFTEQEKKVFQIIERLRADMAALEVELAKTPRNACAPPENFNPRDLEEIPEIKKDLDTLDLQLRWIPGGVYRFEGDSGKAP